MYALLRAAAGVALRWYYRDIQVDGSQRVPRDRPLLLVVNHPNALVDALLVGWVIPRRVLITAKSTLFTNRVAAAALRWLGVLPLRRVSDEVKADRAAPMDPSRNRETFAAVHTALRAGGTVLIFPEGKTPETPALAPLKTGAARMALHACESGDVNGLAIVPIGLTFERKEVPRTRVLVSIGEPILVAEWQASAGKSPAEALTAEIEARLRSLTLSYASVDDAARAVRVASVLAAIFEDVPAIGVVDRQLRVETVIARRIEVLSSQLRHAEPDVRGDADALLQRLVAVDQLACERGVVLEDVRIRVDLAAGARFVLREGWYLAIGGPIALWGRLNHWLPFTTARAIAMRNIESDADPAMRTIVAGATLVAIAYLAQTALVGALFGPVLAFVYLISLPIAADINFALSDRLRRAARRARAFLLFRKDRRLQARLGDELDRLRHDVAAFEKSVAMLEREAEPVGQ